MTSAAAPTHQRLIHRVRRGWRRAVKQKDSSTKVCAFASVVLLLAGCQFPPHQTPAFSTPQPAPVALSQVDLTNRFDQSLLLPPTEPFTLGPGDKLEIQVVGDLTTKTTTVVGPDGKIYFNLLPGLDVWGATLSQAKALLERELAKYPAKSATSLPGFAGGPEQTRLDPGPCPGARHLSFGHAHDAARSPVPGRRHD